MADPRSGGLTREEAARRLEHFGPNAIPQPPRSLIRTLARHFWAPIPWVLEATLALTLLSRRYGDAIAVAFLLIFNAVVAAVQEGRARGAVELLRSRVVVQAHVRRDGSWGIARAEEIVPDDLVHLGTGDIVPADVVLTSGSLEVDQSVLTGESVPKAIHAGDTAYAATLVTRGDATALVTATGSRTAYGKTAELVRTAKSMGQLERVVLRLVSILTMVSIGIIVAVSAFAFHYGFGLVDVTVFGVMILLASVPIALPAAFTLATTFGSLNLARKGALITRLSALEDAASMDVICTDKTGTITKNRVAVQECRAFAPFTNSAVLALAVAASDDAGQDPIDLAILRYAGSTRSTAIERTSFFPFDPQRKYSSATIVLDGRPETARKGAPPELKAMVDTIPPDFDAEVERLATAGARVLAVAVSQNGRLRIAGLFALADPPRDDAAALVQRLHDLGLRVLMLTGDTLPTALFVAQQVGIAARDVRASVYPADKLRIVKELESEAHVVGMTGDGINDAPALRQANIGIAVSNATDVAKAAAGIVLTQPGLSNIVIAIEASRAIFERMVTYTMMKLVKYFEIIGVLTVGFFATRQFLLTPELLVMLLVFNDFVTLSLSTDNVAPSSVLDVWRVGRLIAVALPIAISTAVSVLAMAAYAFDVWHVTQAQLPGVVFLSIVLMGQIAVYIVRDRQAALGAAPSLLVIAASIVAVAAAELMAIFGILMAPIPASQAGAILGLLLIAGALIAFCKFAGLAILRHFGQH
jgi:H+-transporting ATPase